MCSDCGINREQAIESLRKHLKTPNLVSHCLASESILSALAREIGKDEQEQEAWGIMGLLHDIDLDEIDGDMSRHGDYGAELLQKKGLTEPYLTAIRVHKEPAGTEKRHTPLQHALAAGETITGLIVATALVQPDRKLASVKTRSIRKRMKEPRFAAGASRDIIRECELIPVELDRFIEISLAAMQGISTNLGL